jgi:hypothetical protein
MSEENKDKVVSIDDIRALNVPGDPAIPASVAEEALKISQQGSLATSLQNHAEGKKAKKEARQAKAAEKKAARETKLAVTRGEFCVIIAKMSQELATTRETVQAHEALFTFLIDTGVITDAALSEWTKVKAEWVKKRDAEQLAKQIAEVEAHKQPTVEEIFSGTEHESFVAVPAEADIIDQANVPLIN